MAKLRGGVPQVIAEGSVLAGRYVVEARLGEGAMGAVYRARHAKFGRPFALKVLHGDLTSNAKVLTRFEREAELAGRLRHTNVASVIDVGVHDGLHYTVMEYASGDTLTALLADGPLGEVRLLDLAKQLCSGLAHAHEVGLIHRDFKPDNVIVESLAGGREVARIVDWGVAILLEHAGDSESEDRLTTKGIVVGTPHYMAPEQARGGAMDHRVDLFALGLICYELLTGQLPFDGDGVDIARANLSSPTPPMRERNPDVDIDPVLEAVVRKLLEKDPDDRPASADAARELFELYERDRASCALLLGVELPVEDRRTTAIEPLDVGVVTHEPGGHEHEHETEHAAADPERYRATDQLGRSGNDRRVAFVAAFMTLALALVLWLGLRGTRAAIAPNLAAPVASTEARAAIAQEPRPTDDVLPPIAEPPPAPALGPRPPPPTKKPPGPPAASKPAPAPVDAPTAADVAKLYGAVGRELKALDSAKGLDATIDLWPRYRWIRFNEWITTPEKRARITRELERLRADIRAAS
jgi:hypothetical protein